MSLNGYQKTALAFSLAVLLLWMYIFYIGSTDGIINYLFSFLFGLTPLVGGLIALYKSKIWGGMKSAVGKSTFFIALGITFWGIGEAIWSYYNFVLNVPAPYPSFADFGFAPSIFFYGLGALYLSKATGAKYGLRSTIARGFAIVAPFVILAFSYYLLVTVARGGVLIPEGDTDLKAIFDIVYPVGDFVGLAIAVIVSGLSFKYLGGKYLIDILSILAGLGTMFIADTIFSYTTTVGTYYNANFGDLILATGMFLLTFGVLGFCTLKTKVEESHEYS